MLIGTINELLIKNGFNFMGGKIFLPTIKDPSGFWLLDHKDSRLNEQLTIESELCHFSAVDDRNFYCFGVMDQLKLPITIVSPKETIGTVQVDVSTLATNYARKEFLRNQDIFVGNWTNNKSAGRFSSWIFAGIQKFGVYCVAATEDKAFNLLTELMAVYSLHSFHHHNENPLAYHLIDSGSTAMMASIQESAKRWKEEEDETTQMCHDLLEGEERTDHE